MGSGETGTGQLTLTSSVHKAVSSVIVTGVILVLLGYFLGIGILYTIGAILLVVGLVLAIAGGIGQAIGGRPHYW